MAPVLDKLSPLVTAEVTIAGVKVIALIDTGATSSCCRWGWYDQWKDHLGPLKKTNTLVIGVGNVPVELKGVTLVLELEWDNVIDHCEMMVLSTLEDVDVILGMDIISRLDVQISGRSKAAIPRPESITSEILRVSQKVVIPAGKSCVFFLTNTVAALTLFEPSDRLPEGLLGLPTLSEGSRVAVQLDNLTEEDITLNPEWEVGTISFVHLAQSPIGGNCHRFLICSILSNREICSNSLRSTRMYSRRKETPSAAHPWWSTRSTPKALLSGYRFDDRTR